MAQVVRHTALRSRQHGSLPGTQRTAVAPGRLSACGHAAERCALPHPARAASQRGRSPPGMGLLMQNRA